MEEIKSTIDANITPNGEQGITGSVLNRVLNDMVDATEGKLAQLDQRLTVVEENGGGTGGGGVIGNLTGYKSLNSTSELPTTASTLGYLIGSNLYVYVGEGGDVNNGTYKDCGEFRGPQGEVGPVGPQGEEGPQGSAGEKGADGTPGITSAEVSVDDTSGSPAVTAIIDNKILKVAFSGLKGEQGIQGIQGVQGPAGSKGDKGDKGDTGAQGNSGYQGAAGELEIVNNLTDGGEAAALSAEVGKNLNDAFTEVKTIVVGGPAKELLTWRTGSTLNEYGALYSSGSATICRIEPSVYCEVGNVLVFGAKNSYQIGKSDSATKVSFSMKVKNGSASSDSVDTIEYEVTEAGWYMIGTSTDGFNAVAPYKKVVVTGMQEVVEEVAEKVEHITSSLDFDYIKNQVYGEDYIQYPTIVKGSYIDSYGVTYSGQAQTLARTDTVPVKKGDKVIMYGKGDGICGIGFRTGESGSFSVKALLTNSEEYVRHEYIAIEDGYVAMSSYTDAFEFFAPRIHTLAAVTINEIREVVDELDSKVNLPMLPILSPRKVKLRMGEGKKVILYGDSLSSTSHNDRYKTLIEEYTGAEVYAGGFDGYTTANLAQDAQLQRIFDYEPDLIIIQVGGNETGEDCGTFGAVTGQTLCEPTDVSEDFTGTYMIQAVDHLLRKIEQHYYNIVQRAGVTLPINPLEEYDEKIAAIDAVKKPYIAIWTTLPQKRSVEGGPYSLERNWLHKRNAIVEVCNLRGFHCIDVYANNGIDWSKEPLYQTETWERINGIYTHDGVHPNPWGYEKIVNLIAGELF